MRNKITRILMLAGIILLFFSGCDFSDFNTKKEHPLALDIADEWRFTVADSPAFALPGYDDSSWKQTDLPGIVTDKTEQHVFWIRNSFELPERLHEIPLFLVLGKVWDVEQTYFNGRQIGRKGKEPPDFVSAWNSYRRYYIPPDLINKDGKNTIAVRVYSNQKPIFNGRPVIAESELSQKINFTRKFFAEFIPFGISVFMAFFAIILTVQYLLYRTSRLYIDFLVLTGLWVLTSLHYFLPHPSFISYNFKDNLFYALLSLLGFFLYIFIEELLKVRLAFLRIIFFFIVIAVAVTCMTATPADPVTGWRFTVYSLFGAAVSISYLVIIIKALKAGNKEARIIAAGYTVFMFSILADSLIISGLIYSDYYYNYIGFPAIILSIGAVLSWRNSITARELDNYSKNLELMVEERTEELKYANEKTETAYSELEHINTNLTTANHELEKANSTIKRDMLMASHVQKSFYPQAVPEDERWEIAFTFQPASIVSGDVYDFYYEDSFFKGLSLMDVSGHGVSSGLIGVLAKTSLFRSFSDNMDNPLGEIIYTANRHLINELEELDSYITGVFIKFTENIIEYVNAGHCDIIIKKTGDSAKIARLKDTQRGRFLGKKALHEEFKTVKISVEPGDTILLYSDFFIEATSAAGDEQYGEERLCKSLNNTDNLTCNEIIEKITQDLFHFTGSDQVDDDLTAIIIRLKK